MMARRYGQRPSNLIARLDSDQQDGAPTFPSELHKLLFDMNVMFVGQATEYKANQAARGGHGPVNSRADALGTLERARQQADEMDKAAK